MTVTTREPGKPICRGDCERSGRLINQRVRLNKYWFPEPCADTHARACAVRGSTSGKGKLWLLTILLLFARVAYAGSTRVTLGYISPGRTSPEGYYRWLDIADQEYSTSYQNSYSYGDNAVKVTVTYETVSSTFAGMLSATNLKPNFAYQLKLLADPEQADLESLERIGLAGRWWQENWSSLGSEWVNGCNLNNKGDGSLPNPNDVTYYQRRDIPDTNSPTDKRYRYTSYLVLDYFVTDEKGNATLNFEANSSYHVLWKSGQRTHGSGDGPIKSSAFDPNPADPAYDDDYPRSAMDIFGEWERLPVGGVLPQPGFYNCQIILTEESFHGSGGSLAGGWAAAVGTNIQFTILRKP